MAWQHDYSSRYLSVDPARRRCRVNRRAFSDPEVFRLEKQRILYRSWQYLGHESEIRKPGDFVARQILDKNLIFVRDRESMVRALLNTCTHRGAVICGGVSLRVTLETLREVEQFVYDEAALLDDWNIDAWLTLFTADCRYKVTPLGEVDPASLSPDTVYFLIADTWTH